MWTIVETHVRGKNPELGFRRPSHAPVTMEALATASASQLPADAPVVPLLRVVTANLMKEPDNEKFRKIKMDGVFPASPPGAREGSVPKKSAGRGRSRSPLRTDARRPGRYTSANGS